MSTPYEGNHDYVFVNYAHADRDVVLPIIDALDQEGYRVWYDDGIQVGAQFPDYIAEHVRRCACFVMFVSCSSLKSPQCEREAHYAVRLCKSIVPIYLEDVELTSGLQMEVGSLHALYWRRFGSDDEFCARLFETEMLYSCLTEDGRRRRGVKPRRVSKADAGCTAEMTENRIPNQTILSEAIRQLEIDDVKPRGSLAEYSWVELKQLSRVIASVESDAEGLALAKMYHLTNENGRLQGYIKPVPLSDGTYASIRILGFRHDELTIGGKAGISFEFSKSILSHEMNTKWTNVGGWKKSEMRRWLNEDFIALLPDELKSAIVVVAKNTNNVGQVVQENDTSAVTPTPDLLWLLSMSEVFGTLMDQHVNVPPSQATYDAEGSQYQLFAERGVTTESYDFCKRDGANTWWWLRSPYANGSDRFHAVHSDGGWNWRLAGRSLGVAPCFCI